MSRLLTFFALFFTLFALALSTNFQLTNQKLGVDSSYIAPLLDGGFPNSAGPVNIMVESVLPIELCLQETVVQLGPLTDCSKNGYFYFNNTAAEAKKASFDFDFESQMAFKDFDDMNQAYFTSYSEYEPFQAQATTSLRTGVFYWVEVRFNDTSSFNSSTSTFNLTISWPTATCAGANNIASPSTCVTYSVPSSNQTLDSLQAGATHYYQISLVNQKIIGNVFISASVQNPEPLGASSTDVPLSIRRNAAPSSMYNDGSSMNNLTVETPFNSTYYLAVTNPNTQKSKQIWLNITLTACTDANVGPFCNLTFVDLTDVTTVQDQTGTGAYQYFVVSAPELRIGTTTEDLEVDAPSIAVSDSNYPTNDSNIAFTEGNVVNFVRLESASNVTWKIAVWFAEGEDYLIWANTNCPNNCQGDDDDDDDDMHGSCMNSTGVCSCQDDYEGPSCTSSGLSTLWIVLIVIFCLIVVALIVGVAVAMYMRQKKRAHYESV